MVCFGPTVMSRRPPPASRKDMLCRTYIGMVTIFCDPIWYDISRKFPSGGMKDRNLSDCSHIHRVFKTCTSIKLDRLFTDTQYTRLVTNLLHAAQSFLKSMRDESSPNVNALISILIVSSHLCLYLLDSLILQVFQTRFIMQVSSTLYELYTPLTWSSLTYHPNYMCWKYKVWNYSLCSFLHPPDISSLFGPNILLSTLFSNTLNLCSSLKGRDQISHPHKTDKITDLRII
jgi:hypothetical protein